MLRSQNSSKEPNDPGTFLGHTPKANFNKLTLLGIEIDRVDLKGALAYVRGVVEGKIEIQMPALIFTPNAEIIVKAYDDAHFKNVLNTADLVLPDGSSLLFAAKLLKEPLKERVTGIDFMQLLLKEAENNGWTVGFLGARPGVIEKASENIKASHPGLKLKGYMDGYFQDDKEPLSLINTLEPDLLFVGMGAPKQEIWLSDNRPLLKCKVALGVGGSFDVFSGDVKRAPIWMQDIGLEWLYRYFKEPRRIKRCLSLPRFVGLVLREKIKTLKGGNRI